MMAILQGTQPSGTDDYELEMLRTAEKLEADNPLWIIVFGVYSRQFVAFPRFAVPAGTMVTALYPPALEERMRQLEQRAGISAGSQGAATQERGME